MQLKSALREFLQLPGPADLVLGQRVTDFWHRPYSLPPDMQRSHSIVVARTRQGKSRGLMVPQFLQRRRRGEGVMFGDPHRSGAQDCYEYEVQYHAQTDDKFFQDVRLITPGPETIVPLNVLRNPHVSPEDAADGVKSAFSRAFPELAGQAFFETLCAPAVLCLANNHLPLPLMAQLLTSRDLREACLRKVDNPAVHQAFALLPENLAGVERMAGALLRRISQICFNPVSFLSLVQPDLVLPMRSIMDSGVSVLLDLGSGLQSDDVKRFLTTLVLTATEQAAFSRVDTPEGERRPFTLLIDEFPSVAPRDPKVIENLMAQLSKFGITTWLVGQSVAQFDGPALAAAIDNCGLILLMGLGHQSAKATAPAVSYIEFDLVKLEALSERAHDVYWSPNEQLVALSEALRHLPPRHCVVGRPGHRPELVQLLHVPDPQPDPVLLEEALGENRQRHHRTKAEAESVAIAHLRATGLPIDLGQLFGRRRAREDWLRQDEELDFGEPIAVPAPDFPRR